MERELYFLIRNIRVPVTFSSNQFHDDTAIDSARRLYKKQLAGKFGEAQFHIYKKSVDARKKIISSLYILLQQNRVHLFLLYPLRTLRIKETKTMRCILRNSPIYPNFPAEPTLLIVLS